MWNVARGKNFIYFIKIKKIIKKKKAGKAFTKELKTVTVQF